MVNMKIDHDFKEKLKAALCINDLSFLNDNITSFNVNLRFEDENNDTPLLYSISDKGSVAYRFFLDKADLSLVNDEGENMLHSVISTQDKNRLLEVIEISLPLIDSRRNDGATPLMIATTLDNIEMAKILVDYGANVNIPNLDNMYPIHIACWSGLLELVKLFASKNARLTDKCNFGFVPISLAANQGHDDIVKFLYSKIY